MKKLSIILFAAIAILVTMSWSLYTVDEPENTLMCENVKALADIGNSSDSICYSEYNFHLTRRVLICLDCVYRWGKGITEGGHCIVTDEEEEE